MKGDFSRNTFDAKYDYSRVLMQQGRVQLDADWNEHTSILLHQLRRLAADLIGPHGGTGFEITDDTEGEDIDFVIGRGEYYVDGVLCQNHQDGTTYLGQPYYAPEEKLEEEKYYLAYLDVWERHLNHLEAPSIREVALGGADTATRAQVVWQVKVLNVDDTPHLNRQSHCQKLNATAEGERSSWESLVEEWQSSTRGRLSARARPRPSDVDDDPCIIPPDARYRGAENQLYRVEIHDGSDAEQPTFKWSRENGSVIFPIRSLSGKIVSLDHLGRDDRTTLNVNDWVEIVSDKTTLHDQKGFLAQVEAVDRFNHSIALAESPGLEIDEDNDQHPYLRRWDQSERAQQSLVEGAVPLIEANVWFELEDGVEVQFSRDREIASYRPGDYWLIPARTETGDVEWPVDETDGGTRAKAQLPLGIHHHYVPLAIIYVRKSEEVYVADGKDCRNVLENVVSIVDRLEAHLSNSEAAIAAIERRLWALENVGRG